MKRRLLLLCAVTAAVVAVAAGGTLIATQSESQPTPPAVTTAPGICTSDSTPAGDMNVSMDPVENCTFGCPTLTQCEEEGQFCQCPRGPGHCVPCGPFNQNWKCVKNL